MAIRVADSRLFAEYETLDVGLMCGEIRHSRSRPSHQAEMPLPVSLDPWFNFGRLPLIPEC